MQELASNPEFDSLRVLLRWMHSYLAACPRYLKKCMLYLSIFPHDIIIRQRRLIRRWIAEGYSMGTDSNSLEKFAEKIFDEVVALGIMQPAVLETTNKVIGHRVNGFFREYILSRPVEENIFFPVEVSVLEKQGHGRLTTEGIGQHLAIGSTWQWDSDQILIESLDFSRLRSLTVDSVFYAFYVSERMRVLRVLDLENARNVYDYDFEKIGNLPSRLKFLSLRGQSRISLLPVSVGGILQLQTLDIRETSIVKLPAFITKLQKLQYIRSGTTIAWTDDAEEGSTPPSSTLHGRMMRRREAFITKLQKLQYMASCLLNYFLRRGRPVVGSRSGGVAMPRGIGRLKALQTLGTVCVNTADSEAILDEIIDSLPQLKNLEISGISAKQGRWSLCRFDNLEHLESLSLQFEKNNHFVLWERIDFPKSLRSLKMIGHVEKLPQRIGRAINLRKLTFEMTQALFTAEVIEQLGRLPSLHTLRLRVSKDQQDGELHFPTARFSKLQVLEIACKSKLHVTFDEGTMEKLELVKFHCLQGSEMEFSGLEHLVSLKQVWLLGSVNNQLVAVQHQLDNHRKIPAPKLELQREENDEDTE